MLEQMGGVVQGVFCFGMAILWGGIAWYLGGFDEGLPGPSKTTIYGLWGLAALAFIAGVVAIYRSLKSPKSRTAAQVGIGGRPSESEDQFVARMLSQLGKDDQGAKADSQPAAAPAEFADEEDEVVARVLAKLQQQKAEREAKEKDQS